MRLQRFYLSALSGSVLCDVQNLDTKCNLQLGQSYLQ